MGLGAVRRGNRPVVLRPGARASRRSQLATGAPRRLARLGPGLGSLLPELGSRRLLGHGPYFFADLAGVSEADEQAAIDAGQIQAGRIEYVGQRRDGR